MKDIITAKIKIFERNNILYFWIYWQFSQMQMNSKFFGRTVKKKWLVSEIGTLWEPCCEVRKVDNDDDDDDDDDDDNNNNNNKESFKFLT